jgi:hypothetical protein
MKESLEVTFLPERTTPDEWHFVVYTGSGIMRRGYQCSVSLREAFNSAESKWWNERGNGGAAEAEAMRWAIKMAHEMATAAFGPPFSAELKEAGFSPVPAGGLLRDEPVEYRDPSRDWQARELAEVFRREVEEEE